MIKKKNKRPRPDELTLSQLCNLVVEMTVPYEDVSEFIENLMYTQCIDGKCKSAMNELKKLTCFFETMKNKNEENCRDLADIYIMIGEVNQYVENYKESIGWFKKAAIVFDRYAVPYHNLATSFIELGDIPNAIKSLEQEIELEPGNYFSRLRLADLYEQRKEFGKLEECLKQILIRNPENIQALHKLILYYENQQTPVDVELLRKRLIGITKTFNEIEIVIKAYHLCRNNMHDAALDFLNARQEENPALTILYLLKAYVYGETRQFFRKKNELTEFKKHCQGKIEYMKNKLEEFGHIFGKRAVTRLGKILVISNPNIMR